MKSKLFGKNINPDCRYCDFAEIGNDIVAGQICQKGKQIYNGKCRSFSYNPLLRVPRSITLHGTYTAEDFKL